MFGLGILNYDTGGNMAGGGGGNAAGGSGFPQAQTEDDLRAAYEHGMEDVPGMGQPSAPNAGGKPAAAAPAAQAPRGVVPPAANAPAPRQWSEADVQAEVERRMAEAVLRQGWEEQPAQARQQAWQRPEWAGEHQNAAVRQSLQLFQQYPALLYDRAARDQYAAQLSGPQLQAFEAAEQLATERQAALAGRDTDPDNWYAERLLQDGHPFASRMDARTEAIVNRALESFQGMVHGTSQAVLATYWNDRWAKEFNGLDEYFQGIVRQNLPPVGDPNARGKIDQAMQNALQLRKALHDQWAAKAQAAAKPLTPKRNGAAGAAAEAGSAAAPSRGSQADAFFGR